MAATYPVPERGRGLPDYSAPPGVTVGPAVQVYGIDRDTGLSVQLATTADGKVIIFNEPSVDSGIADATSTVNWLDDASKNWPPSPGGFENLIIEITEGTGVGQFAKISANTATRLTFVAPMPVAPDATSKYRIGFFGKMAGDMVSWGGTLLTGRDITLDLAALSKIVPIAKAAVFNTALPVAEADWLGAAITPTNSPSYLRIYACVSVAGILRVARTVGGVTVTENLNAGNALTAGAAYIFTVPWRTGDSINIRYSVTTGTINRLLIEEIGAAE